MVKDSPNFDDIGNGLKMMCWTLTISMIPVTLAVLFCKLSNKILPTGHYQKRPIISSFYERTQTTTERNTGEDSRKEKRVQYEKIFCIHQGAFYEQGLRYSHDSIWNKSSSIFCSWNVTHTIHTAVF